VWTAQIAVTMVALAIGYYAGGRFVDRSAELNRLYWAILAAGIYLALSVPLTRPVAEACLKFDLAAGSLLASAFLFLVPLGLLAMVGPFLIRVFTVNLSGMGGNVGRLSAISTLGSFVGTLLIGYVLIPLLPNSVTMYLTAAVLMAVSLGFLLWQRRAGGGRAAAVGLVALAAGVGWPGVRGETWQGQSAVELFRGNSNFGLLQVVQMTNSPLRYYLNDYLTQNTYDTNTGQSVSMFTYMLHRLAKAYTPRTDDVLCIGVGVGIVPMDFAREGARVDAVEINPDVIPVARDFFGLDPARLNLALVDGRYFVHQTRRQYDAICLDAFLGDSCPSHLMTREAFAAMAQRLKPDGVLVINTFAEVEYGNDFFGASLLKTLSAVFPSVRIHHVPGRGNTIFVASPRRDLAILRPPRFDDIHPMARADVESAFASLLETDPTHGRVLTDDYNPVEFRDAANRERIRKNLALSMHGW
jgi:SAM-dependent methyltransferase